MASHPLLRSRASSPRKRRSRVNPFPSRSAADIGIATTGIAGPVSADGQPVGTVHLAVSTPLGSRVESLQLEGDRDGIRAESAARALRLALDAALSSPGGLGVAVDDDGGALASTGEGVKDKVPDCSYSKLMAPSAPG